jgi:hypothetical protein
MTKHRHSPSVQSNPRPYRAPVATGRRENPRAHGGCEYTERCKCGAERRVNASAGQLERGKWS